MKSNKKGFTLIELLIVVVIVGILALAAIPLITSNTRDARRAEGEQLLGSARDFCRVQYSKTGNASNVSNAWTAEVANGTFTGKYFNVTTYTATAPSVATANTADGTGTMAFQWGSGSSTITWT